ncbi:MAG: histidine--tRNA ligase [Bacteroidales bacterium]|jgi:histidyl-tRNA synthetase|nr:histidine--tRNA ligase [Bacteroidales bacterium]
MSQKPSIPKGTRDFGPKEMARRNYIFDIIRNVFMKYGYQQIETPAMENLTTLMGKYGEEGDKLLFRILNSGDFLKNAGDLSNTEPSVLGSRICEKGLRYDLTVPFARYVVQNRNDISFPFKRFQIQPVWRADRPQKGRYREFYQCDIDVIGSNALLNEAELLKVTDEIFKKLNLQISILLNNRKILSGLAGHIGHPDKMIDITVAVDKLDKIGLEKVNEELINKGIPEAAVQKLQPILLLQGSSIEKIQTLRHVLKDSEIGQLGLDELEKVIEYARLLEVESPIEFDLTLARGLNYYTGAIIEVKSNEMAIGSISGGGRYDDLTGIFGLSDVSGVGISFGADRIYDVLEHTGKFPSSAESNVQALILNFGEKEELFGLSILNQLRKAGISAEMYPEAAKLKKQMSYADDKNIGWTIMAGAEEILSGSPTLKNMKTGHQEKISLDKIAAYINASS